VTERWTCLLSTLTDSLIKSITTIIIITIITIITVIKALDILTLIRLGRNDFASKQT
jgi:hypothetical protein